MGRRVDVLGVEVSAVSMNEAVEEIAGWIARRDLHYVCVTGVHGVMEAQRDPELRQIHNRSGMTTPDGMPMVWAGRWAGARDITRVYGPDLMIQVCTTGLLPGWRHFFYGGGPGVSEELSAKLSARIPGLRVAGTYTPPFRPLTEGEAGEVISLINESGADLVWIGLSTPKQERWMAEFRPRLSAPVLLGVGAAFDIHAGRTRQAPPWMQKSGMEWFYRLLKEPRRLWRRYLRNNPAFVLRLLLRKPRLIEPRSSDASDGSR